MIQIHRIAQYVILETGGDYSLSEVESRLAEEFERGANQLITLILDIRRSIATPSTYELQRFGKFLDSVREMISGGVYITGDELRWGLSHAALAHGDLSDSFGRVQLSKSA